jgi:hypothetical protein
MKPSHHGAGMAASFACTMLAAGLLVAPAAAQDLSLVQQAIGDAAGTFVGAGLGGTLLGIDLGEYRDALVQQRFASSHWGGTVAVAIDTPAAAEGSCARFAAYVVTPPQDGAVRLVLCPEFFLEGAGALRELTILHEMVHVVAGPGECRALAFAAAVQQAAHGRHTPVDAYWTANGCAGSEFALP